MNEVFFILIEDLNFQYINREKCLLVKFTFILNENFFEIKNVNF